MERLPSDPIERLSHINELMSHLRQEQAKALYEARLQNRFDIALKVSGLSRKRGLAATRAINESLGRATRWGGL